MNQWTDICAFDDLPLLGARVLKRAGANGRPVHDIAIFRNADGEVFALEDRCPHKGGPLSQGIVFGRKVACPLHGWNVALDSGEAIAPDHGCTRSYAVKVENGRVLIDADALAQLRAAA